VPPPCWVSVLKAEGKPAEEVVHWNGLHHTATHKQVQSSKYTEGRAGGIGSARGGGRAGGAGSTAHAQGKATRRCWEGMGGGRPLVQGLLMIGCRSSQQWSASRSRHGEWRGRC
jgi:hypothetical protein